MRALGSVPPRTCQCGLTKQVEKPIRQTLSMAKPLSAGYGDAHCLLEVKRSQEILLERYPEKTPGGTA